MADRSPSLQANVGMSRKRSAPGATPASATDFSHTPTSLGTSTSVNDPFEDYTMGAAPKLRRTASGRQPRHHLRLQRPHLPRTLEHQTDPLSASSSNLASPFAPSPITRYEYTPPNSAFSTSFGQFQHAQQMLPSDMDRNDSLGGPIYHQMTQMNLSSSFDPRRAPSAGILQPGAAPQQQLSETYELDPASMTRKYGNIASSPPIDIPRPQYMLPMSHQGPPQGLSPTMPPPQYLPNDLKLSPSRLLAPRPSPDCTTARSISSSPHTSAPFPHHAVPIKVEGVEKYRIARLERHRIEKQKLFCDKCNKQPDGFRGAHELQRHKDAQHSRVRKVWVCVDGSQDKTMLSNCKNCRAMKTYPAYYNAAAHLRRMHFKPKPEFSQKGKSSRAGIGGGDNPPIEILKKFWMKQVVEIDGKIAEGAELREHSVEVDFSSEDEDIKEESFEEICELDNAATEAAERAIPHLSSTIDTIGSYVEVSPEETGDFTDFDYECLFNEPSTDSNSSTTRSLQQNLCDSVTSAGSQLLGAVQPFGDFDFSDMFSNVTEFSPST